MPEPPYKEARLVNADKPLTTRWYITFSAWDASVGKLKIKKFYKINTLKTKKERLEFARKEIAKINGFLAAGYHINPKRKKQEKVAIYTSADRDYTIDQAFKYILPIVKATMRKATHNSYNSVANLFLKFCDDAGWLDFKIRTLTKNDVIAWLDYLQAEKNIGNSTRNKYMSFLSALFTLMKERQVLTENVAQGIKSLRVDESGNTAYTQKELEALKKVIQAKQPRLWLFISFMLYGFIRPAEIARLRVKMIDLKAGKILMPGTITKNRKPRAVSISPPFKAYIQQLELESYRPDDFVFGKNLKTGPTAVQHNFATQTFFEIKTDMGFGSAHTLYSWKHTGVVLHYKAGVDIKTLQAQIGHQSLHETDVYLKSLHLYENNELQDKSPVI